MASNPDHQDWLDDPLTQRLVMFVRKRLASANRGILAAAYAPGLLDTEAIRKLSGAREELRQILKEIGGHEGEDE